MQGRSHFNLNYFIPLAKAMSTRSKDLIILADASPNLVIEKAAKMGFKILTLSQKTREDLEGLVDTSSIVKVEEWPSKGDLTLVRIKGPDDLSIVEEVATSGNVLIDSEGWKIIPLENLIASLGSGDRIYAIATTLDEARSLLGVLERGIRGVVVPIHDLNELSEAKRILEEATPLRLVTAEVTEVREIGMGDRVCVDTASILSKGEGMLIGGSASLFLLVHSENLESPFTSPREFRVNAGAISNYILVPNERTKYLSEIKSGAEVLAVNKDGKKRIVSVGRAKVERRPLVLIRVKANGSEGWAILQLAETVPLVRPDGSPLPVTEAKIGDKVLVYVEDRVARHFGMAVEEFIEER